MRKVKTRLLRLSSFALFVFVSAANATHMSTTTCSNSCVTTTNSSTGTSTTSDCCGGVVETTYEVHNGDQGEP